MKNDLLGSVAIALPQIFQGDELGDGQADSGPGGQVADATGQVTSK